MGNKLINIEILNWVFLWYFSIKLWYDLLFYWREIRYFLLKLIKKNDVVKWVIRGNNSMDLIGENIEEIVKLKCMLM